MELLQHYFNDTAIMEDAIRNSIHRQTMKADPAKFKGIDEFLEKMDRTLNRHMRELHECMNEYGKVGEPLRRNYSKAIMFLAGLYERTRPKMKFSETLHDDYIALQRVAMAYEILYATAISVGDDRASEIALSHLKDLTPFIVGVRKAVPIVVAKELFERGDGGDVSLAAGVVQEVEKAWLVENADWKKVTAA